MTIKVFISLITGEGQFKCPLHGYLESQLGSSLWIPGNLPRAMFVASPLMASSSKISFLSLSHCHSPFLGIPFPHILLFHLLPSLTPPFLPSLLSPSQISQDVLSVSSSQGSNVCLSQGSSCYLASLGLWTVGWLSFALHPLMSEYISCLPIWVWVTSLKMVFSSSIHGSNIFQDVIVFFTTEQDSIV